VWTPRRVLLLLGGILLFGGMYGFYSRFLGWLDGLPPLPAKMLFEPTSVSILPRPRSTSPTIERIREAFGPDCLEQQSGFYPTQLKFDNSDNTFTVLACGSPPFDNSKRVVLSPFSVAQFGAPKTKPADQRQPDEAPEISTFHADKAVLEFDRPVNGPNDMAKAKLIRMELISEPDPVKWKYDHRTGLIHITNNQHSTDPGKFLVVRTVGPLFYRDPKNVDLKSSPGAAAGPDVWTDAAVEIIDRQNLPRKLTPEAARDCFRVFSMKTNPALRERGVIVDEAETAPVTAAELQSAKAIAEVLTGQRLPPPTVTAIGMKIFLDPPNPPAPSKGAPAKKNSGAFSGLRRIELHEKVLVNLWVDMQQGLLDDLGPAKPVAPTATRLPLPSGFAALGGSLATVGELVRQCDRALLQVDTLGKLIFDAEKNTARFDVLPDGNPDLPNDVQVHRVQPLMPGLQRLFCQFLELDFNGTPIGADAATAAKSIPASKAPATQAAKPERSGTSVKRLRAWVEAPGRFVTLNSEPDRLEAYGQYLLHDKETQTTSLRGMPLYAHQDNEPRPDGQPAGGNILSAGTKDQPATMVRKPSPKMEKASPAVLDASPPDNSSDISIEGPGRFELFDQAANAATLQASWQTRMTLTKKLVDNRALELYTFNDGAMFEDRRAEFWLKGKTLQLWMEPKQSPIGAVRAETKGGSLPHLLLALEEVSSHSADLEIEQAEKLTVWFRDGVPPAPVKAQPAAPAPKVGPTPAPAPTGSAVAAVEKPKEPQKQKPPLKVKARFIDSWMVRYPAESLPKPTAAKKVDDKPGSAPASLKYEMDKARCEGRVEVHQDATEPGPDQRGLDILGQVLLVDSTPDGSVMTVTGADEQHPGQVHHDGTSIIGAKIVLDQLKSTADVEGRGSLKMPSSTNLNGTNLKQASVVVIHWRDSMKFRGAVKLAEFKGKITAQQNESYVTCHEMLVNFDRPVDFSQRARKEPKPGNSGPGTAKIDKVNCYPAPDDLRDEPATSRKVTFREVTSDETGRIVKTQWLEARELEMNARVLDPATREPYQRVIATGPGRMRVWQSDLKDESAPQTKNPMTAQRDTERKLTIVTFAGIMTGRDYGARYQDATFTETIDLLHCPADRDDAVIDQLHPPASSVSLTCAEKLVVSSHKLQNGTATQEMNAYGNAYIRSDEYDGWGEVVSSKGPTVTLAGGDTTLARITGRYNNQASNGKKIVYNRITGDYTTDGSYNGTIQLAPKPAPPPVPKK
jgi:hypothetical protein